MSKNYVVPGLRTPFFKAGGLQPPPTAIELSIPLAQAMAARARPDFVVWGQVIPDPAVSNLARELWQEAELDPEVPAWSAIMACTTSMVAAVQAAGMLCRGGAHLAMVGGVETMSRVPIALHEDVALELMQRFAADPAEAAQRLSTLSAKDFRLPVKGWANRITGRSMGEHTEDTAKFFGISRQDQDALALSSHRNAVAAWETGFFAPLVVPFRGHERDGLPRPDTSAERLAALPPVFDRGPRGTLSAGNSSPLTDGAAAVWLADEEGLRRLGAAPAVELVDWELAAMAVGEQGILMAPARAVPRLLARHGLKLSDIALWEIHEAFAAQVLANVRAIEDSQYRRDQAGVDVELGAFPWERLNRQGGSLALGHPFAATGARILSQAAQALAAESPGSHAVVSVCADGGQGVVALLRRV